MKMDLTIGQYHKLVKAQKFQGESAKQACKDKFQGDLVSFSTEAQNNAFMLAAPLSTARQYWLGLKRDESSGNYVWKLKDGTIHDMDEWPTVRNSDKPDEACIRLLFYNNQWIWADTPCNKYHYYICMKDALEGAYASEAGAQTDGAAGHHLGLCWCWLLVLCTLLWAFIADKVSTSHLALPEGFYCYLIKYQRRILHFLKAFIAI